MSIHPFPAAIILRALDRLDVEKLWTDILTVSESSDLSVFKAYSVSEISALQEFVTRVQQDRNQTKEILETLTVTEAFAIAVWKTLQESEISALQEFVTRVQQDRNQTKEILETLTASEAFAIAVWKTLQESETSPLAEFVTKAAQARNQTKEVLETITVSELAASLAKSIAQTQSESVTLSEFITRTIEQRALLPDITSAYQNLDDCPSVTVGVDLDHTNGTTSVSIDAQWKNGTGGSWSSSQNFTAGSTTIILTGVTAASAIYVRAKYSNETVWDEYGTPTNTQNCI